MPIMQQFSSAVNNNTNNNSNKHQNDSNNHKTIKNNNNKSNSAQLQTLKMQAAATTTTTTTAAPSPSRASPPEFDFNLPCRYFKSSFARSLSLNNGGNQCKSLDFDIGHYRDSSNAYTNNNNTNSSLCIDTKSECPPLPQRTHFAGTATTTKSTTNAKNEVSCCAAAAGKHDDDMLSNREMPNNVLDVAAAAAHDDNNISIDDSKPPAIPARCPIKPMPAARSINAPQQQQQRQQQVLAQLRHVAAAAEHAKMLPLLPPKTNAVAAAACGNFNKTINHTQLQQQQQPQQQQVINNNHSAGNCRSHTRSHTSNIRRNIWPRDELPAAQQPATTAENATATTPNYNAMARSISTTPTATTSTATTTSYKPHETTVNVEVVVLQNQVDTLQWQLKQVETSCEMYRAVIEEVARFLDRYHNQKQQQQQLQQQQQTPQRQQMRSGALEQISRSKSLYQVYGASSSATAAATGGHEKSSLASGDELGDTTGYLRTRSSTNLIDLKHATTTTEAINRHATLAGERSNYDGITPADSYTTFKDFTWRRSPKKQSECKAIAAAADLEAKLNQEAFRLSRTIHNLLSTSTRQPDLTQHRNSPATLKQNRLACNASTPTNSSNNTDSNSTPTQPTNSTSTKSSNSLAAEMLFLRANNMRDSRLSVRSSTDSSVHSSVSSSAASSASSASSTSSTSSKVETDEEATSFHSAAFMSNKQLHHPLGSATEDESGFSSISSFQDIGVPLCSTMISNGSSTPSRLSIASFKSEYNNNNDADISPDSRNSTLKATNTATFAQTSVHPTNVVGVPLQATHDMQHRWDPPHTPTKTFRNANKLQRFSTLSNEESATVLWV